jgi:endonuclease/exonuclease/phosphatase family metal-dependent hydrolase
VRKPPELLVTLAPAIVITLVVLLVGIGFGLTRQQDAAEPRTTAATAPATGTPDTGTSTAAAATPRIVRPTLLGPRPTLRAKELFRTQPSFAFQIATFNVLGNSHTVGGGDRAAYADSRTRMGWAIDALRNVSVDVVGFQELQTPQYLAFRARAGGNWDAWPGTAVTRLDVDNTLAWDTTMFRAVEKKTLAIPYFFGRPRNMPYVLLEHIASGQRIWVANFHNPAHKYGASQAQHRREATRREITLANELTKTGYPVFFTGDMNERELYFCPVTQGTALKSASGGSTGAACQTPGRMPVDWIFGSESVGFSGYSIDDSGWMRRITDHPLVHATATVPERRIPLKAR